MTSMVEDEALPSNTTSQPRNFIRYVKNVAVGYYVVSSAPSARLANIDAYRLKKWKIPLLDIRPDILSFLIFDRGDTRIFAPVI